MKNPLSRKTTVSTYVEGIIRERDALHTEIEAARESLPRLEAELARARELHASYLASDYRPRYTSRPDARAIELDGAANMARDAVEQAKRALDKERRVREIEAWLDAPAAVERHKVELDAIAKEGAALYEKRTKAIGWLAALTKDTEAKEAAARKRREAATEARLRARDAAIEATIAGTNAPPASGLPGDDPVETAALTEAREERDTTARLITKYDGRLAELVELSKTASERLRSARARAAELAYAEAMAEIADVVIELHATGGRVDEQRRDDVAIARRRAELQADSEPWHPTQRSEPEAESHEVADTQAASAAAA